MQLWGPDKYSAAADLLRLLQNSAVIGDEEAYGDTQEKREVMKIHLREVVTELDAIASMGVVDALIDGPVGFIGILRMGRREEVIISTAALREPLQKFLSVSSPQGTALRECYSAADAALDEFQHALAEDSAGAVDQLARAMDGLSTTSAFKPRGAPR